MKGRVFAGIMVIAFLFSGALATTGTISSTATAVAYSIKELKTVEYDFGYLPYLPKDTNATFCFDFFPPDRISETLSSMIRMVYEQKVPTTTQIWLNGQRCEVWNMTSTIGKSQYVADFKCVEIMNSIGQYNLTFRSTADLNNIHARLYMTYVNDPLYCRLVHQENVYFGDELVVLAETRDNSKNLVEIIDRNGTTIYSTIFWNSTNISVPITPENFTLFDPYFTKLTCIDEEVKFNNSDAKQFNVGLKQVNLTTANLLDEVLWNFQFDRDATLVSNHDYCIDNQTLGKSLTYEYCIGSECKTIVKNETIPCDFGCENDQCVNPTMNWLFVGGFIVFLLALAFFYSQKETTL